VLDPAVYARVFEGHAEGAQILEELARVFAKPAKLEGGIDAVIQTYHRNGQRSVVEWIVNRVNIANGVPDADADP
jgi:hypothetical protein